MYNQKGIIDRFEGEYAIIRLDNGQTLAWAKTNLPPKLHEGDAVVIELKDSAQATLEQQALAKEILNEIFNHATQED